MKKYASLLSVLLFIGSQLFSQIAPDKYFIQFTDKKNSPYSIDYPEDFLTARAIARRQAHQIPIVENDIPVNQSYVQKVASYGVQIFTHSRWMNGITIETKDTVALDSIENLPFVKRTLQFKSGMLKKSTYFKNEKIGVAPPPADKSATATEKDYGSALTQIKQIQGVSLHEKGFRGQGMVIAILDAGYADVPGQPLFDSLRNEGRLLGTKDFVNPGGDVYPPHYHGRMVLSCMAADDPGVMIGTAPKASYWLLRTEDAPTENIIEEYNWVSGAEFADSVGADVINSSLGYIGFDDPSVSHTYADMDGKTCVSTIGAEIAASKGMLVVNSAGNEGQSSTFPWISAPADGDSVFTIGAVDASGHRASFSSIGPTFDGRIKPTVMAMGQGTAVASTSGVTYGNGTSFSSPVMAGMSACLWQAHPTATNIQIIEALKTTASMHAAPDNLMGWGIPDFTKADSLLQKWTGISTRSENRQLNAYPNPFHTAFQINLTGLREPVRLRLLDISGRVVYQQQFNTQSPNLFIRVSGLEKLSPGIYLIKILSGEKSYFGKVVKE
jgi:serine protease AprX